MPQTKRKLPISKTCFHFLKTALMNADAILQRVEREQAEYVILMKCDLIIHIKFGY